MLADAQFSVADFACDTLAVEAAGWSRGAAVASETYLAAARLGLFGLCLPERHGGLGLGFPDLAENAALLAAADFGFAMSVVNTHNVALNLSRFGTDDQRKAYLPQMLAGRMSACTALTEPGAGTDVGAMTTVLRETDIGWVLSGEKTWLVNGRHAGLAIVFAQTRDAGDRDGIAAVLVDLSAPGVTRYPLDSGFAQTSMGTGGIRFESVEIPVNAMLMAPGQAFKSILAEINAARTYVAAMCDAMLKAAISEAQAYGVKRMSFGRPLNSFDAWRGLIAPAEAALATCSDLTAEAIADVSEASAARAKIASVEACQTHLPALFHAMGAEGLMPDRCFTRHIAASHIAGLTDGTTLILKERLARLDAKET